MYQDKRRSCPRDSYQAPVLISDKLDGSYLNATMHNKSKNGMYLISNQPIGCDAGLYVNRLDSLKQDIYRGFYGHVKWCKELKRSGDQDDHFGIGINFVIKSHHYFGGIAFMTEYSCDICGENVPFGNMIKTKEFVLQCPKCHDALECYPDGNLKSCITNYLMGNIL